MVGTQIMDGLVLLISIVQIRCIIRQVGFNNKMVHQTSFVVHGTLFVLYCISTFYWAFWNHKTSKELDNIGNTISPQHPIKDLEADYQIWMKSYYICLLQFSFFNLLVQLFSIYIFYGLTKKQKKRVFKQVDRSTEASDQSEVERISHLEQD